MELCNLPQIKLPYSVAKLQVFGMIIKKSLPGGRDCRELYLGFHFQWFNGFLAFNRPTNRHQQQPSYIRYAAVANR
jgi:hypothetical protein